VRSFVFEGEYRLLVGASLKGKYLTGLVLEHIICRYVCVFYMFWVLLLRGLAYAMVLALGCLPHLFWRGC